MTVNSPRISQVNCQLSISRVSIGDFSLADQSEGLIQNALNNSNNFQKTDGTLIIERVRPSDESKYVCIARNIGGVTEESF